MARIDKNDYTARAREARGNWKKFSAFGWWGQPNDADDWMIGYTRHRESPILDQSNATVIARFMAPFVGGDDCREERHGHAAVGWIDGYAIRCIGPDGEATLAFQVWTELQDKIEAYPILDEDDFYERERDACIQSIDESIRSLRRRIEDEIEDGDRTAPARWPDSFDVYDILSRNETPVPEYLRERDIEAAFHTLLEGAA